MNVEQLKKIFGNKVDYQIIVSLYDYNYSMELINQNEFMYFNDGYISFGIGDGFCIDIDWNRTNSNKTKVQDFYNLINDKNIRNDEPFISWDTDDGNIIHFKHCICSDEYKLFILII